MKLEILTKLKKHLLEIPSMYIYKNEEDLERITDLMIKYITNIPPRKISGLYTFEIKEGNLYFIETLNNDSKVHFKVLLKTPEDFRKIYTILSEKTSLNLHIYKDYTITKKDTIYRITINNTDILLKSDNIYDKEWINTNYKTRTKKINNKIPQQKNK